MAISGTQRAARRATLIQAAMEVMAEQGVAASRLADVGARAGISTGQVLYYFESKADLLVQALREVERTLREQVGAATNAAGSAAAKLDAFLDLAAPTGPGDFRLLLWLEAWALAPRDPAVAEQVRQLERDWHELLVGVLAAVRPRRAADPALRAFAVRFSAMMDGLTIQVVVGSSAIDRDAMLQICRAALDAELRIRRS
jgi:AcrR family transcriptional regulator